jgi:hypothetical protein
LGFWATAHHWLASPSPSEAGILKDREAECMIWLLTNGYVFELRLDYITLSHIELMIAWMVATFFYLSFSFRRFSLSFLPCLYSVLFFFGKGKCLCSCAFFSALQNLSNCTFSSEDLVRNLSSMAG